MAEPLPTHARVGVIGRGRFGSCLLAGLAPDQPVSRERGEDVADPDGLAAWIEPLEVICLAVRDDQIGPLVRRLARLDLKGKGVLIHSGLKPLAALHSLRTAGAYLGKLHPLFSFSRPGGRVMPSGIPFAVEADPELMPLLRTWIVSWRGALHPLTATQWTPYHLAAVMAANFLPVYIRAGAAILEPVAGDTKSALEWLQPLIEQTVRGALDHENELPYSGPAVRGDQETIADHLSFLDQHFRRYHDLYKDASSAIAHEAEAFRRQKP